MENKNTNIKCPNLIGNIRKIRGLNRKRLAPLIGQHSTVQICLWESGKKEPSLRSAIKLHLILNASIEQIFRPFIWEVERDLLKNNTNKNKTNEHENTPLPQSHYARQASEKHADQA